MTEAAIEPRAPDHTPHRDALPWRLDRCGFQPICAVRFPLAECISCTKGEAFGMTMLRCIVLVALFLAPVSFATAQEFTQPLATTPIPDTCRIELRFDSAGSRLEPIVQCIGSCDCQAGGCFFAQCKCDCLKGICVPADAPIVFPNRES